MISQELIKRLNENSDFDTFKEWILGEIDKLNSVTGFDDLSSVQQIGEVVKARALSITTLNNILEPFTWYVEKKEPTIAETQKAKNKAGL